MRKFCSRRRWGRQGRARAGRGGALQAGGRREAAGPQPAVQGACASGRARRSRAARGDNVGLAVGRALPGAGHSLEQVAGARAGGRGASLPPSSPRPRPTRVPASRAHPDLRAPAPPSFLFAKLHRDRGFGVGGRRCPWARSPSFCLGAVRPPATVGTRRQEGLELGPAARGIRNPASPRAAGRGSRDPRWQCSASLGFRRKSNLSWDRGGGWNLYKTKPRVCLRRQSTPEDSSV